MDVNYFCLGGMKTKKRHLLSLPVLPPPRPQVILRIELKHSVHIIVTIFTILSSRRRPVLVLLVLLIWIILYLFYRYDVFVAS